VAENKLSLSKSNKPVKKRPVPVQMTKWEGENRKALNRVGNKFKPIL
jgi:hypothetical protein